MATAHKSLPENNHNHSEGSDPQPFLDFQEFLCDSFPLSSRMVAQINRYVEKEFEPRRNGHHK